MSDLDPSQFIVGTSAWGSRITVGAAVRLGAQLAAAGFTHFDSAPTYGSAYSHIALRRVAEKTGTAITVDTKHGQLNERNLRGLAKKLLRAPSPGALISSLWQHPTTDRSADEFWSAERMYESFAKSRRDLAGTTPGVFYYHAPPRPVLGDRTAEISARLAEQGAVLGLSSPSRADLEWLGANPDQRLVVFLDSEELVRHYDIIGTLAKVDIRVHGIFRNRAAHLSGRAETNAAGQNFEAIVKDMFVGTPRHKFVIGINSQRSADGLSEIAATRGSAAFFS